jgi:hypothetical protein
MEQLLILNVPEDAATRQTIERKARVVQEGSDKLLVVEGSADAIREAAQLPGVTAADSLAADAAQSLSPSEQVFLEAWRQRSTFGAKKSRIGEGLSWGAEGFKAP